MWDWHWNIAGVSGSVEPFTFPGMNRNYYTIPPGILVYKWLIFCNLNSFHNQTVWHGDKRTQWQAFKMMLQWKNSSLGDDDKVNYR